MPPCCFFAPAIITFPPKKTDTTRDDTDFCGVQCVTRVRMSHSYRPKYAFRADTFATTGKTEPLTAGEQAEVDRYRQDTDDYNKEFQRILSSLMSILLAL